jgi:sucrose phosphorylase
VNSRSDETAFRISESLQATILDHLTFLYGAEPSGQLWQRLEVILRDFHRRNPTLAIGARAGPLTERDAILITYGDQFQEPGCAPLQTLHQVLTATLNRPVTTVHVLPFYPYSSDDGFSVIDYTEVNPTLGTWADLERLGQDFRLMFDAVINHISRASTWFQRFLVEDPAYADWFITVEPGTDLSQVVRPRALPLLTPVQTASGEKLVWTTFSDDQIDLNYAHPAVLLKIIEILLFYVEKGALLIRLDAIAYLWKKVGTPSIHLEETHRVVKLMRCVLDAVAPRTLLVTETNVPHEENISYFGAPLQPTENTLSTEGSQLETGRTDEAQMVYQFPLPPLVVHSILTGSAEALSAWAAELQLPAAQATFFNFTASHDGIGVMPARGLLTESEIQALVDATLAHGGHVSYKDNPDGSRSVYELNISFFDALSDPTAGEPLALQVRRFALSQAIMLSLAGVPGIYVHSLIGSQSWHEGVIETGRNRTINREKLARAVLERDLAEPASVRHQVFAAYGRLLRTRAAEPAFHPFGPQRVLQLHERVFALVRISPDGSSHVLCLHNVSAEAQSVPLHPPDLGLPPGLWCDLLTGDEHTVKQDGHTITLPPYGLRWLKP